MISGCAFGPAAIAHAGTSSDDATSVTAVDSDRFIVTFEDDSASASALEGAATDADVTDLIADDVESLISSSATQAGAAIVDSQVHAGGTATFTLSESLDAAEAQAFIDAVTADGQVAHVEPDLVMHAMSAPNDPRYTDQWSLAASASGIGVEGAWQHASGRGINVAVIDSGINANHPDLSPKLGTGYDFMSDAQMARDGDGRDGNPADEGDWMRANDCGDNEPPRDSPSSWHGSHVSGIIGAATNNGEGMAGVAPDATIVPLRALGWCGGLSSDIADALTWATGGSVPGVPANTNPAQVVNMSLGGRSDSCPRVYQNAIDAAVSRGAIVVVAAGNSFDDASRYAPANCRNVIVVGATGPTAAQSYFSNYGNSITVSAPGGDFRAGAGILSTVDGGRTTPVGPTYGDMQGTSQAAPHVAGVVALMKQLKPGLTVAEAARYLTASATPVATCTGGCGAGIIDAAASVAAVARDVGAVRPDEGGQPGTPAPTPTQPGTPTPTQPGTPAPSTPVETAPAPSAAPTIALSNSAPYAGEAVTITATGFRPGEQVTFAVDSWNYRLSTLTADASGTIRAQWVADPALGSGYHVFYAVGHANRDIASAWFAIR